MEEMQQNSERKRRKLTPFEQFSQTYLPAIIGATALLLILIFLIGAVVRGFQRRDLKIQLNHEAQIAAQQEKMELDKEFKSLMAGAAELAEKYEYEAAIELLQTFSGNPQDYPTLERTMNSYREELNSLEQWTDFDAIPNLSFEMLIADPQRAFKDANYAKSYKEKFITTEEFKLILEELYKNGYILIRLNDLYEYKQSDSGSSYFVEKDLYLPKGKKPLIITQTQVNYNLYMVDSNSDWVADAGGAGFASKLIIDENGNFANEFVTAEGTLETGAYDLIPILESFIATHPDFSYRGARAVIALSGYNGLFGYRTQAEGLKKLGEVAYNEEIEKAKLVAKKLQQTGYELACYSYENKDYAKLTTDKIKADMSGWTAEVVPILGKVDIFVMARNSDLTSYTGDSYRFLKDSGFQFFLGYCKDGKTWVNVNDQYVRQGRIWVTALNLANNKSWFNDILDPSVVLLENR